MRRKPLSFKVKKEPGNSLWDFYSSLWDFYSSTKMSSRWKLNFWFFWIFTWCQILLVVRVFRCCFSIKTWWHLIPRILIRILFMYLILSTITLLSFLQQYFKQHCEAFSVSRLLTNSLWNKDRYFCVCVTFNMIEKKKKKNYL